MLPVAAFVGALVTTVILYRLATRARPHLDRDACCSPGIAIGALANAGIGFLVFLADDRQLRDITFWLLGSLGGATWGKAAAIAPFVALLLGGLPFIARGLDLIVLGEAEAFHMGVAVERLKRIAIVLVAAATGAAVSVAGVIGFVGIVVPHLLRLVIGPGHRLLLPAALCLGAILLLVADTFARVARGAGRAADRHRHRGDRRAVLPRRCCCASARWSGYDARCIDSAAASPVRAGGKTLLDDVSLAVAPGETRRAGRAERRRQIDAAARARPASCARTPARSR